MGEITFQQALEEYKTVYMPARNLAARTRNKNTLTKIMQIQYYWLPCFGKFHYILDGILKHVRGLDF